MTEFLAVLEFSFSVTGPIFVILGLGVWLRRVGMLTDGFVNAGSELVFKIALPALLFLSVTKIKTLRAELGNTAMASVVKLVLVPLAYTAGAIALGFRDMSLGIVMLMASAPSAAASYVMVRAMGGNGTLAANIVAITTLGSLVTTTSAITILRSLGLM